MEISRRVTIWFSHPRNPANASKKDENIVDIMAENGMVARDNDRIFFRFIPEFS